MARLTTLQKTQLDNMNSASQRAGGLGTRLDELEYGGVAAPDAGTLTSLSAVKYSVNPALANITAVHAAITLTDAVQNITTGITNPDFPRTVTIDGNDANVTGNVVFTGTNINDEVITDTVAANGTATVASVKAFKTVTNIQVPVYAVAGTETISIGTGAAIGLPVATPNASTVLAKTFDGAVDGGSVTVSSTVAGSLYTAAGTFNGSKVLEIVLLA